MQRLSFNHAFDITWKRLGRPLLYLIADSQTWSLPDGVTFDQVRQEFVDGFGNATEVDMSASQSSVPYLPVSAAQQLVFTLMGTHQATTAQALIIWTAEREAEFRTGWGVGFRNRYKTLTDISFVPEMAEPLGILLSLGDKE